MPHTPGKWTWWTSNSWRRLMAEQGGGKRVSVLMPVTASDGHPDLIVRPEDMPLIEAAPDLLAVAKQCASECADCNYGDGATGLGSEGEPCEECADIRAAIAKAEGRT